MKLTKTLTLMVAMLLIASLGVYAGEAQKEAEQDAPKELKAQTHCPVMGGEIDTTIYTDIQGQRIYHCCAGCSDPLKKDPDKFFKKAAAEGILFENIQTTCPVSGEELVDKAVFTDFEGRRVALCCANCVESFNKEPQKYLSLLDNPAKEDQKEMKDMKEMKETGHEGHSH